MTEIWFDGPAGRLRALHHPGPAGQVLLLLPGLTCHAGYFDGVAAALADRFDVYALDWRGHGGSDHAPAYGFGDYVADLAAVVRALAPRELVLVGHSLGGYVALRYAATPDVPARPAAIVAADVKTGTTPEELAGAAKAAAKPQPAFASLEALAGRLKATMPDSSADEATLRRLAEGGARRNEDGTWAFVYDRAALAIEPVDPFAFAAGVAAPTLVLHGDRSPVMAADAAARLAAALPAGRAEAIADAGHHPFLDRPAAFVAAVDGFLAGVPLP